MLLPLLTALAALATTPAEVSAALATFNKHAAHQVPTLDDKQVAELLSGEVVRILNKSEDPEGASAAVAYVLSSVSREALWIAAQDPHTQVDPDLSEVVIRSLGHDRAIWYGYWDLPRPVRDRHWVVDSQNTHSLAAATGGKAWEHTWTLVPDGLADALPLVEKGLVRNVTLEHLESAIFTPANKGSWFMVQMDDGSTLLGNQVSTVVGGAIPDWLVTKLALARMESVLRGLEERGRTWCPTHYTGAHEQVFGGDGKPMTVF